MLTALTSLSPPLSLAQESERNGPADTFADTTEVIVQDVMVEVVRGKAATTARRLLVGEPGPKPLRLRDLEASLGSEPLRVVDVERRPPTLPFEAEARWQVVIYLDRALASTVELRWAAGVLAERIEELVALGTVEVWLASPEGARAVVPATRSATALDRQLSQLALFGEAEDGLASGRYERLEAARAGSDEADREAWSRRLVAIESAAVAARHDLALLALEGEPSPRRALFLVGLGADLEAASYYRRRLGLEGSPLEPVSSENGSEALQGGALQEIEGFARALASRGWSVFPLVPPAPEAGKPKRGLRLGQLRFQGLVVHNERDRRPERARSYLDLGDALVEQGELEEAADAYRKAAFHFHGDPRTLAEQATAMLALATTLERLGELQQARRATEIAADLDPDLYAGIEGGIGWEIEDPEAWAELVAGETGGLPITTTADLDRSLVSIAHRTRISLQLAERLAPGELQELDLAHRDDSPLRHVRWLGRSTPERLASALLRQRLGGDRGPHTGTQDGSLEAFAAREGHGRWRITWRSEEPFAGRLRISWAFEGSDRFHREVGAPFQVEHGHELLDGTKSHHTLEIEETPTGARGWLLLEDLETSRRAWIRLN